MVEIKDRLVTAESLLALHEYNKNAYMQAGSIPEATTSNNGQFLTVVNGVPTWTTIPNAEGESV